MASSAASSTNALLALNNQRPTENDKVPFDDVGGPRNDGAPIKTGSTADYADFGFDATHGISPDTTRLPKAGVPGEPRKSLPSQPGESATDADVPSEDEDETIAEEVGANAPDPSAEDVTDAEKLVKEEDGDGDEDDADTEVDLSGIDLDELAGDDVDLIDLPSDTVDEEDGDEDVDDEPLEEEDGDEDEEDEDDKPMFESRAHARSVYRKLKGLFEAEDQTDGKRDDDKEEIPTGDDDAPKAPVAEGLFDDEDEDDIPSAEVDEESDPLTTQNDATKDPNAKTGDSIDELGLGESRKRSLRKESKKFRMKIRFNEGKKLFEGNTVLAEEDIRQSRALFESAVRSVATDVAKQLRDEYQKRFNEAKLRLESRSTKQIDRYLSYVVEQWAKDNKVALRSQLRAKLSENFVRGLKKLFVENYVEVPKNKTNVVTALARNVKALKEQVQKSEAKNVALAAELKESTKKANVNLVREHKARLVAEAASALPASERGKFAQRALTLEFKSSKTFKKDLVALREQYNAADKVETERPLAVPNAAPLFEERQRTAVDAYADAVGKLAR